ncbi:peptidase M75 family protein [Solihabitans fulvus]|uniref:Peptidase M75 family protein n=1 Tax=Solihabitans fulvus TaxID=1892852 RepID=A0A5B2WVU7_9PSEU|nr:iron uptake system protein EfeO [Solihabitans fulvus]KAA2255645.1 peptidase M75 family protein [Solihabitans fulvus]
MTTATPRAVLLAALGLGALTALTACGGKETPAAAGSIAVEAGDDTCKVSRTTAEAGNVTFEVANKGSKITEFYVYGEGDRILGEVENVGPGLNRRLIVELPQAGKFQTACKPGMVGNGIRGEFTVTGGAGKSTDTNAELAGATKSYQQFVANQTDALEQQTAAFVDAVKAGKVEDAKKLYAPTRVFYERVEPVAEKFGDLDPAVDAREADVQPGEKFTGFHRLEKDLWVTGLQADSAAIADKLLADTKELIGKVKGIDLTALDLANGAKSLLDEVATKKVTGEEETFSHTDLWDFRANLDGSKAAIAALRPVVEQRDKALVSTLDDKFAAVDRLLEKYRSGDGYTLYTELSADQVKELAASVDALGEPLSKVAGVVATK